MVDAIIVNTMVNPSTNGACKQPVSRPNSIGSIGRSRPLSSPMWSKPIVGGMSQRKGTQKYGFQTTQKWNRSRI